MFETFFGELQTAPPIRNCPVAMECRLHDVVDTTAHERFIGEVVATYANPAVLTESKVDLAKVQPLLFDMSTRQYWTQGQPVAKCWDVGKKLQPAN